MAAAAASKSKKKAASSRKTSATRADKSVDAFRDALERSVTISRDRLQEVVDESVKRGRMTRRDAEELVSNLVSRGRKYQNELLKDLEKMLEQSRKDLDARTADARKRTRKVTTKARKRAEKATTQARKQVTAATARASRAARDIGDEPLKRVDEARRRAGLPPSFPITAYDQLTVPQIKSRLTTLEAADLRKVRTYEKANDARKGILDAIEKSLGGGAKPAAKKPAKKAAAKKSTARKPAAKRSGARKPAARRSTAARSRRGSS